MNIKHCNYKYDIKHFNGYDIITLAYNVNLRYIINGYSITIVLIFNTLYMHLQVNVIAINTEIDENGGI